MFVAQSFTFETGRACDRRLRCSLVPFFTDNPRSDPTAHVEIKKAFGGESNSLLPVMACRNAEEHLLGGCCKGQRAVALRNLGDSDLA